MSKMKMRSAAAPAVKQAPELQFYPCEYTWTHPVFGALSGHTVIRGADEEAALKHFRSIRPHLTGARIVRP